MADKRYSRKSAKPARKPTKSKAKPAPKRPARRKAAPKRPPQQSRTPIVRFFSNIIRRTLPLHWTGVWLHSVGPRTQGGVAGAV